MPDNKLAIVLTQEATTLASVKKMIADLEALKQAASGSTKLTITVATPGGEESVGKFERAAERRAAAEEKAGRATQNATRATRTRADAFKAAQTQAINVLNETQRIEKREGRQVIYGRAGLSPELASEAELLRLKRQNLTLLTQTHAAAKRGDIEAANRAVTKYNKVAGEEFRLDPRLQINELELESSNQILSLERQIGLRTQRFGYRLARDRGTLRAKNTLTDEQVNQAVGRLRTRVGADQIIDYNREVQRAFQPNIAQLPLYVQEAEKAGEFKIQAKAPEEFDAAAYVARIESQVAAQAQGAAPNTPAYRRAYQRVLANLRKTIESQGGFVLNPFVQPEPIPTPELDAALRLIEEQKKAGSTPLAKSEMLKAIPGTEGRGFEVTGKLPPVRTTPYPPTLLEMQQGITQQQIDRARAAAGLPSGPGPATGGGKGFYSPSLGLYGPGVTPFIGIGGGGVPPVTRLTSFAPGDWQGGGGGPPVNQFGIPVPGFGGGGGGGGKSPFSGWGGAGGGFLGGLARRSVSLLQYAIPAAFIYPIFSALANSVKEAAELEVIMKRIQGIYGSHTLGEQLQIKAEVVRVAQNLSVNLVETARTAQLLAQEQIPISKLAENLTAIAQGAVGLGISQQELANYVIAIRNATAVDVKPLEGPQLINLITSLVRRGAVSPQNLLTSIQQIVPTLETFSPNLNEINDPALIGAITSVIARRSNFTGSQVANFLKFMIAKFGNPEVVRQIERRAKTGLGTAESGGQELRPFINIVQDLATAYKRLVATGQTAAAQNLLKQISNARQTAVGAVLFENWDQILVDAQTAIRDTTSATELATIQQDTWNKSVERLKTVFALIAGPVLGYIRTIGGAILEWLVVKPVEGYINLFQYADDYLNKIKEINKEGGFIAPSLFPGPGAPPPPSPYANVNRLRINNLIASNIPGLRGEGTPIITPSPETSLYNPEDWDKFNDKYEKRVQLLIGQQQAARDFGALFASPRRDLTELTRQLEIFYETIKIGERESGENIFKFFARRAGRNVETLKQMTTTYNELQTNIGRAAILEKQRLIGISGYTQGTRLEDATARALNQTNRVRRTLARTFGRRGLDEFPVQTLKNELDEIAASRLFDIQRENAAYATKRYLLEGRNAQDQLLNPDFYAKIKPLRDAELIKLKQEHDTNLAILDVNSRELGIQTEINAIYESRLKDLQQIETLSQNINNVAQSALQGLPGGTRSRGVLGNFLASLLVPFAGTLFKSVTEQFKITGRGGLFPGIGETLNKIVGPPSLTKTIQVPKLVNYGAGRFVQEGFTSQLVLKTPEELQKEQRAATIRALEIALASTLGAAVGGGGQGAQVGGQLGAIGGFALGSKLGFAGAGPLGAVAGGLIGGLFGGLFTGHKPPKPELTALEKIARNTGESVTLIENTNRLLELQNIAFNIPTGFTLPRFGPSLFGGTSTNGGSFINVEVNVGGSSASPQQIGNVVAQAVSSVLEGEYRSGGRYVARTTY